MNRNDLFRAFNSIDDDILERSEVSVSRRKKPVRLTWGALAACLLLAAGLSGVVFFAEAKEYGAATEFCLFLRRIRSAAALKRLKLWQIPMGIKLLTSERNSDYE